MAEQPKQFYCLIREHETFTYTLHVRVFTESHKLVGEHFSSNSSWARTDATAIAEREGGVITRFVDQSSGGRPWVPMPLLGINGCPVCGNLVFLQREHCLQCPPVEELG